MGRVRRAEQGRNSGRSRQLTPHVEQAQQYIQGVISGKLDVCDWVGLACERQIRDLLRRDWEWVFDPAKAERSCCFVENLQHIEGPKRGAPFILEPWQCLVQCCVYGWVHRHTRKRRFRRVLVVVPRGNGKSTWSAGNLLHGAFGEGEGGAQVYTAATTTEQAQAVFRPARAMVLADEELRSELGLIVTQYTITQRHTNSFCRALSKEAKNFDGKNVAMCVIDELHAHKSRELYDVLVSGMGKRDQSLLWSLTTAGSDQAGICYEQIEYMRQVLNGRTEDERYFFVEYTIDESDDWADIKSAAKANPNWGVSVYPDFIEAELHQALRMPSEQSKYKTRYLDVWVNADTSWLDTRKLAACADPTLREDHFESKPCFAGVDIATKLDICAKVKVFAEDREDGKRHYTAFGKYWLPEEQLSTQKNAHYIGWEKEGLIELSPGETNDFALVEESIREDAGRFELREVDHDAWQFHDIRTRLEADGIVCVEIPMRTQFLSPAMKEVEAAIQDGRFHYSGDKVLTWALLNVVCHRDANDNIFPRKQTLAKKIDPAVALFLAMARIVKIADIDGESAGVSAVGNCDKCGAMCIGKLVDGKAVFDCGKHTN